MEPKDLVALLQQVGGPAWQQAVNIVMVENITKFCVLLFLLVLDIIGCARLQKMVIDDLDEYAKTTGVLFLLLIAVLLAAFMVGNLANLLNLDGATLKYLLYHR
jgi:hypothetical protein